MTGEGPSEQRAGRVIKHCRRTGVAASPHPEGGENRGLSQPRRGRSAHAGGGSGTGTEGQYPSPTILSSYFSLKSAHA